MHLDNRGLPLSTASAKAAAAFDHLFTPSRACRFGLRDGSSTDISADSAFRACVIPCSAVPLGAVAVRDPTDVYQDGAAADRRCRGRLVGRDGLLPGGAVARLRLRASAQPHAVAGTLGARPSWSPGSCRDHVADRHRSRLRGCAAGGLELWLLALFAASIGLPFVALAASAPLLQNWFAASGHPHAANPYLLYAASNLGSFVALMTYPFVVEPLFTLHTQILTWSVGYVVLILLIAAAAVIVARAGKPSIDTAGPATVAAPTIAERTMWTVFAAIPAGLVVAVTAAISTDLAAAPFLWVLPLSLYLLTFVAIFRDRAWVAHGRVLSLVPFAAVALIATASAVIRPYWSAAAGGAPREFRGTGTRLPWRTLSPPAGAGAADGILFVDLIRRYDRRHLRRADRPARVQRHRRVSHPDPGCAAGNARRVRRRAESVSAAEWPRSGVGGVGRYPHVAPRSRSSQRRAAGRNRADSPGWRYGAGPAATGLVLRPRGARLCHC